MKPAYFANLIYDHWIIDIPKILDLCAIYGDKNTALLSKMINHVFTQQPKYVTHDLPETLHTLVSLLNKVLTQFGCLNIPVGYCGLGSVHPPLSKGAPSQSLTDADVIDACNYVADLSTTLINFIRVYNPVTGQLIDINFLVVFTQFYELFVHSIQHKMHATENGELFVCLNRMKQTSINLAYELLSRCYIEKHSHIDDTAAIGLLEFEVDKNIKLFSS